MSAPESTSKFTLNLIRGSVETGTVMKSFTYISRDELDDAISTLERFVGGLGFTLSVDVTTTTTLKNQETFSLR